MRDAGAGEAAGVWVFDDAGGAETLARFRADARPVLRKLVLRKLRRGVARAVLGAVAEKAGARGWALQQLDVTACGLRDADLAALAEHCSAVRGLALRRMRDLTGSALVAFAPSTRVLRAEGIRLGSRDLRIVGVHADRLLELSLDDAADAACGWSALLPAGLLTLRVRRGCGSMGARELRKLPTTLPKLGSLKLGGAPVDREALCAWGAALRKGTWGLADLALAHCRLEGISAVAQTLSRSGVLWLGPHGASRSLHGLQGARLARLTLQAPVDDALLSGLRTVSELRVEGARQVPAHKRARAEEVLGSRCQVSWVESTRW